MKKFCSKKIAYFFAVAAFTQVGLNAYAGDVHLGGFSQLTYSGMDTAQTGAQNKDTFAQGGIDLYLTKNLDEKTNILAEVVFEIGEDNEAVLDPERMYIQHEWSPWLKVAAGRVHTALGYWNETFHHGSWLQTSVGRPSIFNFEDEGGILPVHSIGLELRGSGDVGAGELGYIMDIGNGRGINADPPQSGADYDSNKAVSTVLYYRLPGVGNLQFGLVYYTDSPAGTSDFDDDQDPSTAGVSRAGFDETITGAHLIWHPGDTELIFEGFSVDHKYETPTALSEKDNTITAYYVQLSHKIGDVTPYARYSVIDADNKGDIYLHVNAKENRKTTTAGVRYDLTYTSAIKAEYEVADFKHMASADPDYKETSMKLNWSYAW